MAAFACRSRDASGNLVEKTVDAESKREALRILEEFGLSPVEIVAVLDDQLAVTRESGTRPMPRRRVKGKGAQANLRLPRKALRRFTVQLGSSLRAGVPMHTALRAMADQAESPRTAATMQHLIAAVEGGVSLSEAMRGLPRAFPAMYVSTIEAGEKSGTLDDMLDDMTEYLENDMEARADVRSAIMYPAIVMVTLGIAISVLVFFVVPRFATFYAGFNAELPLPTRILIATSKLIENHGLLVLGGMILLAIGAVRLARIPAVRRFGERQLLRIPYIGRMIEAAVTLQIAQMLHLFTGAGMPLLAGLQMIADAMRSTRTRADLYRVAAGVETGATLAEGLEAVRCLPSDARQVIATGEQTGSLQQACAVVAKQYKKELKYMTRNVATFIEPVLTLFLAVVVLFIALAAFLPMWDLVKVVRK